MSDPIDEYNILLYGETGAGKSTFINALNSYIKYRTLDEAFESKICCCIPVKFTWENDDYESTVVEFGSDKNENVNLDGESATQNLTIYNFEYKRRIYRFIDTPGFNDTRGYEMDLKNTRKVVKFLEERFQRLHAVCILLKPDENRQTLKFRYNIKSIFSTFHRNFFKNFIFLFTHSGGVDFRPSGTNCMLQDIFHEIETEYLDVTIPNNNVNCFFIDNLCYKYLLAVKLNADSKCSKDIYSKYWTKSVHECFRLLDYVHTTPSYTVKFMLNVAKTKFKADELCDKIVKLKDKFKQKEVEKREKSKIIESCKKNIERLKSREYDTNITIQEGPYHMICTNRNCEKGNIYGREGKACCPNCTTWIKSWCYAFSQSLCTLCGCSIDNHELLHIPHFREKCKSKNKEIQRLIHNEEGLLNAYKEDERILLTSINKIKKDIDNIQETVIETINFLKNHGILVYNNECIDQMKMEILAGNKSSFLKNYLETYKSLYQLYNS